MKKLVVLAAGAVIAQGCVSGLFIGSVEKPIMAELGGGVTMELLPVPAGSFMMGSNEGDSSEKPVHPVTISESFWRGKTEVTQVQYKQMTGENPSHFQGLENPVESVSKLTD